MEAGRHLVGRRRRRLRRAVELPASFAHVRRPAPIHLVWGVLLSCVSLPVTHLSRDQCTETFGEVSSCPFRLSCAH